VPKKFKVLIAVTCLASFFNSQIVWATNEDAPIIRAPGVTQAELEAFAEAHGRLTFSKQLELARPGVTNEEHLRALVEKAQAAWLSGSLEQARTLFKEMTRLTLEADWREPQRASIHYAYLRLAQLSLTPNERDEWIERAVLAFPDLKADSDLFPPPLVESFQASQTRLIGLGKIYQPYQHFPDYKLVLINGKSYENKAELQIRLPATTFRVTGYSDAYAPITEKLTFSQMQAFRLALPKLASGSCDMATTTYTFDHVKEISVLYPRDCLRTQNSQGWLSRNADLADVQNFSASLVNPIPPTLDDQIRLPGQELTGSPESPPSASSSGSSNRTWLWIGAAVLAVGAAYALHEEMSHRDDGPVTPVQHQGF
jgi:hypothetical protein